jgi:hypothetical protein
MSMQVNATMEPRSRLRHDDLLMEELPKVAIRLENAGPLGALDPLFELDDDALDQGRQNQHRQDLGDLKQDVPGGHRRRSDRSHRLAMNARIGRAALVCRRLLTQTPPAVRRRLGGVISPKGG